MVEYTEDPVVLLSLGCYNNIIMDPVISTTDFISHSSGSWEVQSQGASRFSTSPGLQVAALLLCSHLASLWGVHAGKKRVKKICVSSF